MRALASLLAVVLWSFSLTSYAWWNEDWTTRKKITLTNPASEVTDAPVLVRLHTGNFDFLAANANGSDVRLIAGDDKTELKFHIEKWDDINQLALIWVKIPKLAAKTEAYLYFGNETAARASHAKGTYDASSLVYHFAEANGNPQDSGLNGLHAPQSTATRVVASFSTAESRLTARKVLPCPRWPRLPLTVFPRG